MLQRLLADTDFLVIGHRGAAGLAPENTLPSFALALSLGCPMLELDVYACPHEHGEESRSTLVVIHDDSVNRTTDGRGDVMAHTLRELRSLDAGDGQPVPLLSEVVDCIRTHAGLAHAGPTHAEIDAIDAKEAPITALNIELKGPNTAAPVAEFLAQHTDLPVLVSSFDHGELQRFRALAPDCAVAPLYHRYREDWRATAAALGACAVNLNKRIATPARVAAIRAAGYAVFVYTVNTVAEAQRLAARGVSGVFSDRPDRLLSNLSALARHKRNTSGIFAQPLA